MATMSALLRRARCLIRCCGILSFIAVLVFALASAAWCTSRNGPQTDIQGHRFRVQSENIDQMPILIADSKNGGFQRNFQEWQSLTPQERNLAASDAAVEPHVPPTSAPTPSRPQQQLSRPKRGQLQRALDNWSNSCRRLKKRPSAEDSGTETTPCHVIKNPIRH